MTLKNLAIVHLFTEKGCDPKHGAYSLLLVSSLLPLMIAMDAMEGDVPLIEECISNAIAEGSNPLPEEGWVEIRLKETGEQQDVYWQKYYEVEDWQVLAPTT